VYVLGYLVGLLFGVAVLVLTLLIPALWAWSTYGKARQRHHAAQRARIDNALAARGLLD